MADATLIHLTEEQIEKLVEHVVHRSVKTIEGAYELFPELFPSAIAETVAGTFRFDTDTALRIFHLVGECGSCGWSLPRREMMGFFADNLYAFVCRNCVQRLPHDSIQKVAADFSYCISRFGDLLNFVKDYTAHPENHYFEDRLYHLLLQHLRTLSCSADHLALKLVAAKNRVEGASLPPSEGTQPQDAAGEPKSKNTQDPPSGGWVN